MKWAETASADEIGVYANGTCADGETTKKIVVSNETANSLFAAMQA